MEVLNFDDYRDYMNAHLEAMPKKGHGQARKIASHLRVSSTFISRVLAGAKSLNLEQGELVAEFLGLTGLEADYFIFLIEKDRAGTKRLQNYWQKKLDQIRAQAKVLSERVEAQRPLSDEEKAVFYSNALISAVHLYTSTHPEGRSFQEVLDRFEVPRASLVKILDFLKSASLLVEKDGRYQMGSQSTHVGTESPHWLRHHTNWRLRAVAANESLQENELMYTVNVSLSKKDFEHLREQMVGFIKKFLNRVHASPAEEIACFNLDFFWIRK